MLSFLHCYVAFVNRIFPLSRNQIEQSTRKVFTILNQRNINFESIEIIIQSTDVSFKIFGTDYCADGARVTFRFAID